MFTFRIQYIHPQMCTIHPLMYVIIHIILQISQLPLLLHTAQGLLLVPTSNRWQSASPNLPMYSCNRACHQSAGRPALYGSHIGTPLHTPVGHSRLGGLPTNVTIEHLATCGMRYRSQRTALQEFAISVAVFL